MPGRFLAMVGMLVRRETDGRYLILQRAASKDFAAGEWECVTGRLEQGESFEDAAEREAMEELGIAVKIEFMLGTTHFYRGPVSPEYEMIGVEYACSIADLDGLRLSDEHSQSRWVSAAEARAFLPTGHWLLDLIERVETSWEFVPRY